MGNSYAERRRQAAARGPRRRQPRPRGRRRAQGRHALAGRARARRTPTSSSFADFAARYDELVVGARDNTLQPDAYQGANITLTNPGGIGTVASRAAADARPGHDRRHRRDRLPARPGNVDPERLERARRREGHDDDVHLRPPRDPGRGVGRVPAPDRRAAPGRGRLLRRRVRGARRGRRVERADDGGPAAVTAGRAGARRRPPRRPRRVRRRRRCSRRCRPPPRSSRRTACTATWPRGSTRSARSRVGDPALDPETVNLTRELMRRSRRACCASRSRARRSPTRCRTCGRPTAARSPTRSSTSPTTSSACGCARRSSRARYRQPLDAEEKRALLERLSQVEALETYLHKAFLGKKQFSIEGLDVLVPMLDEAIELASERAARARSCSAWPTAAG